VAAAAIRRAIEIEHRRAATGPQQAPQLLKPGRGIRQVAQAVGHHRAISPAIRQIGGRCIALPEFHRQPGLAPSPLARSL